MQLHKYKLNMQGFSHLIVPAFFILAIGGIGAYVLSASHAATPTSGIQLSEGVNNYCLDDYHSGSTSPSPVDIWSCNKTKAQSWAETTATTTTKGGEIKNNNGICLNVSGNSKANGATVNLLKCSGATGQLWYVKGKLFKNPNANKCLADYLSGKTDGTKIVISTCSGSPNQTWTAGAITSTGGGGNGGGSSTTGSGGTSTACNSGGSYLWSNLATCGWPDASNTGPVLSQCPGDKLTTVSGSLSHAITITKANSVVSCEDITGMLYIDAPNVTVENVSIESNSGKTGEAANGTADIFISDGASATIKNVNINGDDGVHACVWDQGTSETVDAVNCYGADDGIWSWPSSSVAGDNFTLENSYIHDLTTVTSNGHEDGYQTEGATNGTITHNTFELTTTADSDVAIWNSLESSANFTVSNNLMTGGGFAIYAEDYNPSQANPTGGFTTTNIKFNNNDFSTHASGCVGQYGVWFTVSNAYKGGPTDGWHRSGNKVLETGQNVDSSNPTNKGALCQ